MIEVIQCVVPANVVDRWPLQGQKLKDFERTTGILKTRKTDTCSSALAVKAARSAIAHTDPSSITHIICVTQSPDRLSPAMAVKVLDALQLKNKNIMVFDVNQACSGYLYGLHLANSLLLAAGDATARALVITVDKLKLSQSPIEGLIFSDAATCTVMSCDVNFYAEFHNDTRGMDHLYMLMSGRMHMNGNRVFEWVTENVPAFIKSQPRADYLVMHQANYLMQKIVAKKSGYESQTLDSLAEYGNTSMNSIPVTICHNSDKLQDESKRLLLCGFGAGWSMAVASINLSTHCVTSMIQV